jgi:tetratricopeptide (TPR) repeat protein
MDAETLFRQGVRAIHDQKDVAQGRQLLIQSLKLDPTNDMAWLWLTRTVKDPEQKLQYVERALSANPANERAQLLKQRLVQSQAPAAPQPQPPISRPVTDPIQPLVTKTLDTPLTKQEKARIVALLEQAENHMAEGNVEEAITQWVNVLKIRADHEIAIRNATGHLWRMDYHEDARELVQRAIDAGTPVSSIYLTAIDMAERQRDHGYAEDLRVKVPTLPQVEDQLILTIADKYIDDYKIEQAQTCLKAGVESHPESQALLVRLGDLYMDMHRTPEAMECYEKAVRLGSRTQMGKEADKKLVEFVPVLTDRERGSLLLAVREALGVSIVFLLMGWQDARLNLFHMDFFHWLGVGLSLGGGYFLVTATSSPQQRPLARLLGGRVPEPEEMPDKRSTQEQPDKIYGGAMEEPTEIPIIPKRVRYVLGFLGLAMLIAALVLVFHQAVDLVVNYKEAPYFYENYR